MYTCSSTTERVWVRLLLKLELGITTISICFFRSFLHRGRACERERQPFFTHVKKHRLVANEKALVFVTSISKMSIYYSGALRRSGGVFSAISKQLKSVNLKGVKRVTVSFNPFNESVKSTRELLVHLTSPKIVKTNPNCIVKTEVLCTSQPSEVRFSLIDSVKEKAKLKEIRILSDNLTTLELLQLCNKHVSALAPVEDITTAPLQTKSAKQQAAGSVRKVVKKK